MSWFLSRMVVAPTPAHPMCCATHSFARAHVALDGPSISLQPGQLQTLNSSAPDIMWVVHAKFQGTSIPTPSQHCGNNDFKVKRFQEVCTHFKLVLLILPWHPLHRITLLIMNWNDFLCQHMCAGSLLDDLGIIFIMRTSDSSNIRQPPYAALPAHDDGNAKVGNSEKRLRSSTAYVETF